MYYPPETADQESSSAEYARRFSGATGAWMLEVQKQRTYALLQNLPPPASVLDVGGGHGQLAIPMSQSGYEVTVIGSDPACAHRIQRLLDTSTCRFVTGHLLELPFADNQFDAAISFRMLTHCEHWQRLVSELCRVAKQFVIVDYPTSESINRIAPWLFEAKKKMEVNTRVWTSFRHQEIRDAFAEQGWTCAGRQKQFFFPMVVHRMLQFKFLSRMLEGTARATGLTRWLGSPVIATFTPRDSNR